MLSKKLIFAILLFVSANAIAQSSFENFHYQAVLNQTTGTPYVNAALNLKVELRYNSVSGTLLYDEQQNVTTNNSGYVSMNVGGGIPLNNGLYADFIDVPLFDTLYFFNLYVFSTVSSTYTLVSSKPIYSVPFSIYSKNTAQKYALNTLTDVDSAGITSGSILRWNGTKWIISIDSTTSNDSLAYATNALHADFSDTATVAITAINIIPSDTAVFAYDADTSNFATSAIHAIYSDSSIHAITADTALYASGMWSTNGNSGTSSVTNFLGTTDLKDINFVTNNITRATLKSDGKFGIGIISPLTDLHVEGNNGFVFQGTFGTGSIPTTGAGTRFMWYPKKSAFRGGTLDATFAANWDDAKIGNYSFSFGRNTRAEGQYSVSFGENSNATAPWSMAVGFACNNNSAAQYSFAAGHSSTCNGLYTVALGRGNTANGIASTAIGYHTTTTGNYSRAFGFYCSTTGHYSTAMGYQAKAVHDGSFIYIDYSNIPPFISTTAANQFFVRAAGGYVFYSNSTMTTGVSLASGSGSWSVVCDSTKKENFSLIDGNDILHKVAQLRIYSWNYKSQDKSIRHIGTTAQQFKTIFGFGENDTTISTVDLDGVNLAAIQALQAKNAELERKLKNVENLTSELNALKAERDEFLKKLIELEALIQQSAVMNTTGEVKK